jgi:hypothetical protein
MSGTTARRARRIRLKVQGTPTWQRNGWASEEQYRAYHRQYLRERRANKQALLDVEPQGKEVAMGGQ